MLLSEDQFNKVWSI